MTHEILFSQEKHVGLITLNRPQALNALTLSMIIAMQHQLEVWRNDSSVHLIVIQASPGKAFCAGGDIRWLYEAGKKQDEALLQFFWHEYRLNHFIHHLNKPYVALMDGITMGGGVGISLHGSHRVASEQFVFAMPETSIGFFPDIGASHLLSRCPHHIGTYLGLTGNKVNTADAKALKLIDFFLAQELFPDILSGLIEGDFSSDAHGRVNAYLQSFKPLEVAASIYTKKEIIEECFKAGEIEQIVTQLQRGETPWHQETLQILSGKSPLSLKVTHAQLQKADQMTLAECLNMDYCLVSHFMQGKDFYEGVRALLVDKDKSPKWQPSSLSQISAESVINYFKRDPKQPPLNLR